MIKHTSGKYNKVVDAFLQEIKVNTLRFENLVNMYKEDVDLKEVYEACENPVSHNRSQWFDYMLQEVSPFKNSKLCIPKCSMRESMIHEKHN